MRIWMLWSAALLAAASGNGQSREPILTWSAMPNPAGTVSLKLDFVSPLDQRPGPSSQALPEARLEAGLGHGLETIIQTPLLRVSHPDGSSVLGGGQLSGTVRYLLAGNESSRYAVSIAGRLEVPTGDSALVGNATQLMPMLQAEFRALPALSLHSNLAWNTTVGATTGKFANFQHEHAIVWSANRFVAPVFEIAGSTSTLTGGSQLLVQPEVIVAPMEHVELKTGLAVSVVPRLHYGIRSQLAWVWGKR